MNLFHLKPQNQAGTGQGASGPQPDPRLTPTPDFGTLGPDSDFGKSNMGTSSVPTPGSASPSPRATGGNLRLLHLVAVMGGIVSALLVSGGGGPFATWEKLTTLLSPQKKAASLSPKLSERSLARQKPQKQAETLLARAVNRNNGATDEIQANVDHWRGKIKWNSELSQLTTVALNSNDQSVRASGIEVQLAAYGLPKSRSTVDGLVRQAASADHAQKIWAFWSLGLLGNRGVEADHVVEVLTSHLSGSAKDSEEDSRRWAVEGLALVGTDSTIAPLLDAMRNDTSALVRERAACSLAESGMLTHEQRLTAVPQLINYSGDPTLDAQTHAWAFQALADITKQRLPNDSAAWRNWYETVMAGGH